MKRMILLTAVLGGCPEPTEYEPNVEISAITAAPPASTAKVTNDETNDVHRIELSQGVAIATRCWDSCVENCEKATLTSADPLMFGARPVYRLNGGAGEFALIASEVGTTTLHVSTACATRDYVVIITKR